jgi:hypothetical protein
MADFITNEKNADKLAVIGCAVLATIATLIISKASANSGATSLLFGLVAFVVLMIIYKRKQRAARLSFLRGK